MDMYLWPAYQDKAATDKLSAMKWLEKELENTVHLFEDRNVSELKTNGDTACYLKSVQLYLWIFPSETRDIKPSDRFKNN